MPLHNHVCAITDEETSVRIDAIATQHFNLFEQIKGIHHHAITDDTLLPRVQDAGRDQMKNIFLPFCDDRVAGVASSLVTDNDIRLRGQDVNNLSFSFISPLSTHQNGVWHTYVSP